MTSETARPRSRSRVGVHSSAGLGSLAANTPAEAALFQAASRGNGVAVRRALAHGADPLSVASDSCKCCLSEESCVCLGYAPIHCAAQAGSPSAVRILLDAQADPCALSGRILFSFGRSSASSSSCEAPPMIVDGITPLHVAAACGHQPIADLLLRRFADPHMAAAEPEKSTPLRFACLTHQNELVDFLRHAMLERVLQRVKDSSSGPEAFIIRQSPNLMGGSLTPEQWQPALNSRLEGLRRRVRAREEQRTLQEQQRELQEEPLPSEMEAQRMAALRDGRGAGGVAATGGA
mmetsp:Transcript_113765/g.179012  ORF Transcript_113765/g.179012 Transcript_113765/m.179012 type:complete len:292 (-) Transcript_113765:180-1055(-)